MNNMIFLLFFLSGFCGLLYQVVWVRMAYTAFGVITPVLSVVISVFMLGLALGSVLGGKWIASLARRYKASPVIFYALTELLIGLGAFIVPRLFAFGEHLLLSAGEMNSLEYLLFSDVIIAVSILPWCILMGFTYPFMMSFLKGFWKEDNTAFSYLYFANVVGAMCGTLLTAVVLIELVGFYNSLIIAASLNFLICAISLVIGARYPYKSPESKKAAAKKDTALKKPSYMYFLLLLTGFTSMAMEVVWVRDFTPVLSTTIYSFASLLTVYLFATWVGSSVYRNDLKRKSVLTTGDLLAYLAVASFLPIVMNDPRLIKNVPVTLTSIFPFCAILGYLTPKLIDEYSLGRPYEAGRAYAVNIAGCIAGPLAASYILLPVLGVKWSLIILAAPFLVSFAAYYKGDIFKSPRRAANAVSAVAMLAASAFVNVSFEELYAPQKGSVVRRDHTATVISTGQGMQKRLFVNGIGITYLTPITKVMAHLPLAFCRDKPASALVICFGMGTTYRSALSWGIKTDAVELVPSVKDAFGYYFADAPEALKDPNGRIIIDDGRRFLARTDKTFDVITIDPPPPVEAAGSSLLYSKEFYGLIRMRLKDKGILQQWFPGGELKILQAVARSLSDSFPYIRVYRSVDGTGFHFLASMSPIEAPSARTVISRMPDKAKRDMMEWYEGRDPYELVRFILESEISLTGILSSDKRIAITDDRPYNEYYLLRREMEMMRHGTYAEAT
ncbi:MAG: fused MFS/spermidine synthase [Candidatus Omnitrophota bacterium]